MIKIKDIIGLPSLNYHLENGLSLSENVYRYSSDSFIQLFAEARQAWRDGLIELNEEDAQLLESTDIGEYGVFEGEKVPLDLPMLNEAEYQGKDVQLNKPKHGSSKFNSLKDIETALTHLIPGIEFERGNEFPSLEVGPKGYIAFTPKNSKNYGVISYRTSDWGSDNVGVLWINGDKHRGYEFTNIKELYSLLEKFKVITEAEYQGKDVQLNKPKRGGSKKFYVYVRNPKTKKIVKVSFGAKDGGGNLAVKLDDPKRRKAFADRHNCDQKKDKTKPGYWSCRVTRYWKSLGGSQNYAGYW